jgi:hypothetical protein
MAWSPPGCVNAGISWLEQPGDYANPIPTTFATGLLPLSIELCRHPVTDGRLRWNQQFIE